MPSRVFLSRLSLALLYLGPLLAGLARHDVAVVPVFVAAFLLALVVLRPAMWPDSLAGWLTARAVLALVARAVVQFLLVVAMLGVGRGLGAVIGGTPDVALWLPIGVSLAAVAMLRAVSDPQKDAEMSALLDDAIRRVQALTPATPPDDTALPPQDIAARERAAAALAPLAGLHDDTAIAALVETVPAPQAMAALDELSVGAISRHPQAARALVMLAMRPAVACWLRGLFQPSRALYHVQHDPSTLELAATRGLALLRAAPETAADFPEAADIHQLAEDSPEAAAALTTLAEEVARLDARL